MKIGFEAKRIFHNKTGLGNYSRDLVKALSAYFPQHEYILYNPRKNGEKLFEAHSPLKEKLPQNLLNRVFSNYWRQRSVLKDLKNDKIEIFHGLSGEIPVGLPKTGIKSVVTIHDLIFLRYPQFYSFLDKKIHQKKFLYAAQSADVVVAVSEQTKKDIVHFLGIQASKIKVVYQGCHPAFKKNYSPTEKQAVIEKYRLPNNFILNVGTVESRKNVLVAVQAIKEIDTHLVIVGSETAYANTVKKYIEANNLELKVTFLKNLNTAELAILNHAAQLVIYPSLFEGFGIPIIEALYSGTPVITTKYGCFPEAGGPHSAYVDPTNIEEVAEKIQLILSDTLLQISMAEKGRQYVQKFNDENIVSQMMNIYKSLV